MGSTSYGYNVRSERQRVIRGAELLTLLLMIVVVCWLVFPRDLSSSLRNARLDAVSLSYMQAWLKAKPDDYQLRLLLANELINYGRFSAAQNQIRYISRHAGGVYDNAIVWLELRRDFQRLMALQPEQRDGTMLNYAAVTALRQVDTAQLDKAQRAQYGEMALLLGELNLAVTMFDGIAESDEHPEQWYARSARLLLANGRYRQAGDEYIKAMDARAIYALRKQYFLDAMDTLEAGGLHHHALVLAATRERIFYHDDEVLFRLLKLAQAGGDLQRAQHYALLLMHMTRFPAGGPPS
ncbi:hypothetical protein [Alcanivorax hongdengensis]|uniref:hypothetical protein n=1 Tax=Alcanivorax hongdengensis TaxID=519051 RepID=UPI0002D277E2|nr:hypothetical protein [Alcanivorax hongdengensis]